MLDVAQLLRMRSAYAGRFDAGGRHLVFVSDLSGVPQVWGVTDGADWPQLLVVPPDRAQTIYPGPLPGQLIVGADVGGNEHTQLLYTEAPGAAWRSLTDDPEHIFNFGAFSPDARTISFSANTRTTRWFDVYVRDLEADQPRCVLRDDSTNRAGAFSPDGRWLIVTRAFSNTRTELWLVDLRSETEPRRLTPAGADASFDRAHWSADGASILCLSDLDRDMAAPARIDVASAQ